MNTREWYIGHHSDIPHDGRPQLQRIENGHQARGFPLSSLGFHVGYHFVIEETGDTVQTRSLDERGAHTDNCGSERCGDISGAPAHLINFRSIGVCLAGDFTINTPKPAQIRSLHEIVWYGAQNYRSRFLLHRETKPTACPVADLHALYSTEHLVWLQMDLKNKQNALRWASGSRRTFLERSIARILRVLSPSPFSV
jgi:N-acetyl-anhydromuramyl-L-alanine amidase AmpD